MYQDRAPARRESGTGNGLQVDLEDLAHALDQRLPEGIWLLDLRSGDIACYTEDILNEDPSGALEDPDLYLPIDPIHSKLSFTLMEEFLEELPEGRPTRALDAALERRKPFRAFKDMLLHFPEVREAWFTFHHLRMLELAEEWLQDNLPQATPIRKLRTTAEG